MSGRACNPSAVVDAGFVSRRLQSNRSEERGRRNSEEEDASRKDELAIVQTVG